MITKSRTVVLLFLVLGALLSSQIACEELFSTVGSYDDDYYYGDDDYLDDTLFVSGYGETLLIEIDTLSYTAQINWMDGNYYFAVDPEGDISGYVSICVASVSEYEFSGSCFRDGHVCDFLFSDSWEDVEGKDSYYLYDTTCKSAASMGPFLVPLDNPLCGEDPYPACPDEDDLFPSGPTDDEDETNDSGDTNTEDEDATEDQKETIDSDDSFDETQLDTDCSDVDTDCSDENNTEVTGILEQQ